MIASPSLAPRHRSLAARRGLVLLLALLAACRRSAETSPPTADAPAHAAPSELRATYDLPADEAAWTAHDYQQARDVFVRLERERPDLLPRLAGPDAAWMQRLVSLTDIEAAARRTDDLDLLGAFHLAVADILQLYTGRALGPGDRGPEYLAVAAAFFVLSRVRLERLSGDDASRDAFIPARYHLARGVHDVLASALSLPAVVRPALAAATFAPIADRLAPWFLPEERDRILDLADRLAAVPVAPADLGAVRTAFAPDREPAPRVEALAEDIREHAERQEQLLAAVAAGAVEPLEVGGEGGQVRWAFPDAGFSAVFPRRPNAQRQGLVTADGVAMTTRMLALKLPGDASRLVTCSARARPIAGRTPADEVRQIADTMHLEAPRAIEVGGARGLEGALTTDRAHALVRVVAVGDSTCVVVIEVPLARARESAAELRRFVDSFRPGPVPR
ncbi:hypothetical protein [Nannocystis bainbridge]|uniref:Uncharacterized protein n=1 Tax=Nannocystis bainbridge TaxID=2995303 RepID=A0ABT5EA42_9BACT|nr:hypothetical protein [Nannocystis bainbridge]MDC0722725.1 hypothetical protein [Nannocystis bainbridge]